MPYIGDASQVGYVSSSTLDDGTQAGCRVLDVSPMGGIHCRVLVGRGLDLGPSWFEGYPLDWRSPVGFAASARSSGRPWLESFGGGLMTTCGPDNVGPDCVHEGVFYGLHGSHSSTPASQVSFDVDLESRLITVRGRIRHAAVFGPNLVIHRTITFTIGSGVVTLRDRIVNDGHRSVPLMLLYHMNFGYPLVSPRSTIEIPSVDVIPRDKAAASGLPSWDRFQEPEMPFAAQVFEHRFPSSSDRVRVVLANPTFAPSDGIAASVTVVRSELPRLWHWRNMEPGAYLTGIEPANCGVGGRDQESPDEIEFLDPGAEREFGFIVHAASGPQCLAEIASMTEKEF